MSSGRRSVPCRASSPPPGKATRDNVARFLDSLSSPDPHQRQAACQALGAPGLRHDEQVVSSLIQKLTDPNQYVRQAATASLGQVARRGEDEVLHALIEQLADADCSVRRVACKALGQTCNRGSANVVTALLTHLEDKDGGVRRAALTAVEKAAEKSDMKVLTALFSRTADGEAFVRHSAVEVLSRLAEEGDAEVVSRLLVLLNSDRDSRVRWAATEALGRLAVRGDSRVLTALLSRLEDEADSVRRAAATALGHVTFAPLQELELQEKHIAELEFRGAYEVAHRDKIIQELEERHGQEVFKLQQRVDELEGRLAREIDARDKRIDELEGMVGEKGCFRRIREVMPPVVDLPHYLDLLPGLAGPGSYGTEVTMPVWALRCVRSSPSDLSPRKRPSSVCAKNPESLKGAQWDDVLEHGSSRMDGKNKRWILSTFELFEQLSTGKVTPMDMTEQRPLDVYIHKGDDDQFGIYCCSRHRLLALLMWQACSRNEFHTVRCTLRPKDDQSYWGWQWASHYDGGDGLMVQPTTPLAANGFSGSRTSSPNTSRMLSSSRVGTVSIGAGGPSSTPSTPRSRSIPGLGRLAPRNGCEASPQALEDSSAPYPSKTVDVGGKGRGRGGKGAARGGGGAVSAPRRSTGGRGGRGTAGSTSEAAPGSPDVRLPTRQRASPVASASPPATPNTSAVAKPSPTSPRQAAASGATSAAKVAPAMSPQAATPSSTPVVKASVPTVNMQLTP